MYPSRAMATLTIVVVGAALMLPFAIPVDIVAHVADTLHCNSRVVVRDRLGWPISGASVSVLPIPLHGAPIGSEQVAISDRDGVAEFAALPAFRYEVLLRGTSARREVRDWSPPPGHRTEVQVGADPWRRPEEWQRFSLRREWTVMRGDCSDSLVVRIAPTRWTRVGSDERSRALRHTRSTARLPLHQASKRSGGLLILAVDDSTGRAIASVDVRVARHGWYISENHWEPQWQTYTDRAGNAWLMGIPTGDYDLHMCNNVYERTSLPIRVEAGSVDTVRATLKYLGPPSDGRRCEVRFFVDGLDIPLGKVVIRAFEKETGQPVMFGNVTVLGEGQGAMTDDRGLATITLAPGVKVLKIDAPGRLSRTDTVRVAVDKTTMLRARLERDPVQIERP